MTESGADYDVAVVGAGPTGLTLANLLAEQGVRVVLIDPNKIVCPHPRASHIDDETMRSFQTLGLAGAAKGYLVMGGFDILNESGERVFGWEMEEGETDQAWLSDYMFFQPDFEATLRGRLATSSGVELMFGWELADFTDEGSVVTLSIGNRGSGAEKSITAAFLVGCDGANSFIRQRVSPAMEDFDGTQRSLIIDVVKFEPPAGLSETKGTIIAGARPFTHIPIVSPISRFEFMLLGDEDLDSYTDPATHYTLLEPWMEPGSYRIMRSDVYLWHSRLATGWRTGRVLLAGDAAHQMPPMLGQGMCSGIRDAANLAWKLGLVVRGSAEAGLLDSYEPERAPHVRDLILESARQANTVAAIGRGAATGDKKPAGEVVDRTHVAIGQAIGSDTKWPLAGRLSPQPRLRDGRRLDDLVGYAFAVLAPGDVLKNVSESTRREWTSIGAVPVPIEYTDLSGWLERHEVEGVLVRPDRYIFAGVRSVDQLETATRRLSAALFGTEVQG